MSDDRLHDLEISQVRMEGKLDSAVHNSNNIRQMVNGLDVKFTAQHHQTGESVKELSNNLKELTSALFKGVLSIIGAIFILMIGIIGYFLAQKDATIETAATKSHIGAMR